MLGFDDPAAAVLALPAFVLPVFVLLSAALEYVVPPYFGDTVVLLAFFLAGQGAASPVVVFVVAVVGSCLGAALAFELGRRYGVSVMRRVTFKYRRRRSRRRMQRLLERFGEKVLISNRFLLVARGFMLFGAGMIRLRFLPSMGYTALSNVAWTGFLMGVGLLTAGTWEQIRESFYQFNRLVGVVTSAAFVVFLFWLWIRSQSDDELTEVAEASGTVSGATIPSDLV